MKRIMIILLAFTVIFLLVGCGSSDTSQDPQTPPSQSGQERARLLLGTSSVGGTYYALGGGWAKVMNDNIDDVEVSVEVTGGPNTNIQLIEQGDMELGFATTWLAGEAFTGTGWAEGQKYTEFRSMFPMYSSVLHIYALKSSGIDSIYDLAGRNVSVGAPGATSDLAGRAVLEALGIVPNNIASLPSDAQINSLKDGTIDACFTITGLPGPFMLDLETTHEVQFIPLEQEDIDKILEAYPFWAQGVIPDKTYKHQTGDVPVLTFWNMCICDKDLDPNLVYDLVKATFDNHDDLVAVDATAKGISAENAAACTAPFHPGALKYFQEVGISIPDKLK
ncbi:MAG: TAXI family TRAP transporter solute-binding subunit [bacterium]|jgi:TRAP transporter TAXI family solute receptor